MLANLRLLAECIPAKQVKIRVPRIPGYNSAEDVKASVEKLKKMGFEQIEVFPYIIRDTVKE